MVGGAHRRFPHFEQSIRFFGSYSVHTRLKRVLHNQSFCHHNHSATAAIHSAAGTRITWARTVPASRVPVNTTTERRKYDSATFPPTTSSVMRDRYGSSNANIKMVAIPFTTADN